MSEARTAHVISDIQVLRAVAILMTLFSHYPVLVWSPWFPKLEQVFAFWGGVDLFFCISGFVIARSLLPALENRHAPWDDLLALRAFWIRRIFRIWPAAWLWIAVVLICVEVFNKSHFFGGIGGNIADAVSAIVQVNNFHSIDCLYYKVGTCGPGVLDVYWSLSLEEQFYIVFPVLLLLTRQRFPWVALAAIALQFGLSRPRGSPLWFVRTDAVLLGVLLAYLASSPWRFYLKPGFLAESATLRWCVTGLLLLCLSSLSSDGIVPFSTGLIAVIAGLMVWIASFDEDYIPPTRYGRTALLWIGSRSYSMYVVHLPVYFGARELWFRLLPTSAAGTTLQTMAICATTFPAIAALTECSYRLIEQPFRRRGRMLARHHAIAPNAG